MYVYAILTGDNYEGETLRGIFSSLQEARKYKKDYCGLHRSYADYEYILRTKLNDPDAPEKQFDMVTH